MRSTAQRLVLTSSESRRFRNVSSSQIYKSNDVCQQRFARAKDNWARKRVVYYNKRTERQFANCNFYCCFFASHSNAEGKRKPVRRLQPIRPQRAKQKLSALQEGANRAPCQHAADLGLYRVDERRAHDINGAAAAYKHAQACTFAGMFVFIAALDWQL